MIEILILSIIFYLLSMATVAVAEQPSSSNIELKICAGCRKKIGKKAEIVPCELCPPGVNVHDSEKCINKHSDLHQKVAAGQQTIIPAWMIWNADLSDFQPRVGTFLDDLFLVTIKEYGENHSTGNEEKVILSVRPSGQLHTVSGNRRVAACLQYGYEVQVDVRTYETDQKAWETALRSFVREDMSLIDEMYSYARSSEDFGMDNKEIATKVGKNKDHVGALLSIKRLVDDRHVTIESIEEFQRSGLDVSRLKHLQKLREHPHYFKEAFDIVLRYHFNTDDTFTLYQIYKDLAELEKAGVTITEDFQRPFDIPAKIQGYLNGNKPPLIEIRKELDRKFQLAVDSSGKIMGITTNKLLTLYDNQEKYDSIKYLRDRYKFLLKEFEKEEPLIQIRAELYKELSHIQGRHGVEASDIVAKMKEVQRKISSKDGLVEAQGQLEEWKTQISDYEKKEQQKRIADKTEEETVQKAQDKLVQNFKADAIANLPDEFSDEDYAFWGTLIEANAPDEKFRSSFDDIVEKYSHTDDTRMLDRIQEGRDPWTILAALVICHDCDTAYVKDEKHKCDTSKPVQVIKTTADQIPEDINPQTVGEMVNESSTYDLGDEVYVGITGPYEIIQFNADGTVLLERDKRTRTVDTDRLLDSQLDHPFAAGEEVRLKDDDHVWIIDKFNEDHDKVFLKRSKGKASYFKREVSIHHLQKLPDSNDDQSPEDFIESALIRLEYAPPASLNDDQITYLKKLVRENGDNEYFRQDYEEILQKYVALPKHTKDALYLGKRGWTHIRDHYFCDDCKQLAKPGQVHYCDGPETTSDVDEKDQAWTNFLEQYPKFARKLRNHLLDEGWYDPSENGKYPGDKIFQQITDYIGSLPPESLHEDLEPAAKPVQEESEEVIEESVVTPPENDSVHIMDFSVLQSDLERIEQLYPAEIVAIARSVVVQAQKSILVYREHAYRSTLKYILSKAKLRKEYGSHPSDAVTAGRTTFSIANLRDAVDISDVKLSSHNQLRYEVHLCHILIVAPVKSSGNKWDGKPIRLIPSIVEMFVDPKTLRSRNEVFDYDLHHKARQAEDEKEREKNKK